MDTIAVLDFGGQYTHLIANRIRRLGVYSEIVDSIAPAEKLGRFKGLILSGGPHSVTEADRPGFDPAVVALKKPILGLCYGHQLLSVVLGGTVTRGEVREYGISWLHMVRECPLFQGLSGPQQVWMSHGDTVAKLPDGFMTVGTTSDCATAAVYDARRRIFGLQFHPEVTDTPNGMKMLDNFITICGCAREWNPQTFMAEIEHEIKRKVGEKKVFMLVSGGVDSSVAFSLLNKVLGPERVLGLHVDNGLMRHEESADIMRYMKKHGFHNLKIIDVSKSFLNGLKNVAEPEKKREIIGTLFIREQEKALKNLGLNAEEWILGQGTIYPDTIESAGTKHADRIKTHHNRVDVVLELIKKGLVIEPLSQLYKDEVRTLGEALGLPKSLVWRHPFPGPGLGVRVLCSEGRNGAVDPATQKQVEQIAAMHGYRATVLPVRSVGVQGDGRTYAHPVLLVGDADWAKIEDLSTRITNTVKGVNRVVFGIRCSPQATYRLVKGYTTKKRLDLLRAIDHAATQLLVKHGQYDAVWQMPVVLLPLKTDKGGECVVLRPIMSKEAMTARFVPLKQEVLDGIKRAARRTLGIGDVFIDVTHKPPGTIEWE